PALQAPAAQNLKQPQGKGQAQAQATNPVDPQAGNPNEMTTEMLLKIRDPFKSPIIEHKLAEKPKTDIEATPVDKLRLVGVYRSSDTLRAMLVTPEGKTFVVKEKSKIGPRGGIVRKITPDLVEV